MVPDKIIVYVNVLRKLHVSSFLCHRCYVLLMRDLRFGPKKWGPDTFPIPNLPQKSTQVSFCSDGEVAKLFTFHPHQTRLLLCKIVRVTDLNDHVPFIFRLTKKLSPNKNQNLKIMCYVRE